MKQGLAARIAANAPLTVHAVKLTLNEVVKEAALAANGRVIHM